MNELVKKVIAGAVSGFVSAVLVDLDKWKQSALDVFDWKLAIKRYFMGAVTGAVTAAGFGNLV